MPEQINAKDMLDAVAVQRNQALDALVEAVAIIKAKDREIAALKEKYEVPEAK